MAEPPAGDGPGGVTALLRNAAQGDRGALDRLFPMVYAELSRIAHAGSASSARATP